MSLEVKMRLTSMFAELAGRKEIAICLRGGEDRVAGAATGAQQGLVTVGDALDELARVVEPLSGLLNDEVQKRYMKFILNGRQVPEEAAVSDGDVIEIYAPFLGG